MREDDAAQRGIERELGDRYQIVRTLGRGAFGAVYLARERQLHRMVAIKVLHADRAGSEPERARLLREARTVANLSHPAIVPLLAFGETAATVYMVMPYVGGETLADRLRDEERLDPREVRRILIEIADALAYAHGEGVLHRDLKPENILLERAGAMGDDVPPRVRLIDFGVAAFPTRDPGVNATYETWGTPHFMAPEQAFGEPELDPRSEVYALGVLGFLLLGGRLPFDATAPTARLAQQRVGPSVPLAICAPDAPRDLVAAIDRCLAYEPEYRWRRARDLRDALVQGAESTAGAAAPLSLVRQRLRAPRRPAPLAARRRRAPRAEGDGAGAALSRAFSGLGADVRFAVRTLRKTPGFTAAVMLTLALGLGATTVVFSAARAVVQRPLPVTDPASLVVLHEDRQGPNSSISFGASLYRYDRYLAYRDAVGRVMAGLAAQEFRSFSVRLGDRARPVTGFVTSGNYFELLGIRPALGRFYTGAQDRPGGAEPVAVVGYDFWRRALGGDPRAVGRTLFVDSRPLTVIGVAPRGFNGAFVGVFAFDVWVPAAAYQQPAPAAPGGPPAAAATRPGYRWMNVFGRLRPGVDVASASAALRVAAPRVPTEDPTTRIVDAWVEPLTGLPAEVRKPTERFMRMLLAVAGLVLLIAGTNAAGMLLARAAARGREVATRLAVGATRARLVRQLLVESTILCLAAGAAGLLLTWWLTHLLNAWQPPFPFQMAVDFRPDGRVLGVAAAVVLGTGLLAGLAPAVQATAVNLATSMKEGGLQGGRRRARLRGAFVVAQVALSVVLLTVAGLFVRALQRALAVDPGFEAAGVAHVGLSLGPHGYDRARAEVFLSRLVDRVRARPEVAAAALVRAAPLSGNTETWDVKRPEVPNDEGVDTQWGMAGPGFVELLRVPLLAGRTFTSADDAADAPPVAVINETLARRLWPGRSPREALSRQIDSRGQRMTVVGVIGNGKYSLLSEAPQGYAYAPLAQHFTLSPMLYLRARGSTAAALRAAREELAALDPNVAFERPTLLTGDVGRYVIPQRVGALLVGVFGLVGLALAMAGLYGVLAYGVAQRTREFGVRMALGARGADLVRLVVGHGLTLVAAGIALGLGGAFVAGRLAASFLFGVSPADPLTLGAVPLVLVAVALLASVVPGRRAAAADPMASLRAE